MYLKAIEGRYGFNRAQGEGVFGEPLLTADTLVIKNLGKRIEGDWG